jgi:hypothetical protein
VRDFIICHYHLNRRDEDFWRQCRRMPIPDSLARKLQLFRATGKIYREQEELFSEVAWLQVLVGQGIVPADYHPLAGVLPEASLQEMLANVRTVVQKPLHLAPHDDSPAVLRDLGQARKSPRAARSDRGGGGRLMAATLFARPGRATARADHASRIARDRHHRRRRGSTPLRSLPMRALTKPSGCPAATRPTS